MENSKNEVQLVSRIEGETGQHVTHIKLEALVTMDCVGQKASRASLFRTAKPRDPQYFKLENKLTLEYIKNTDPLTIGMHIKDMYRQLMDAISQYEKN